MKPVNMDREERRGGKGVSLTPERGSSESETGGQRGSPRDNNEVQRKNNATRRGGVRLKAHYSKVAAD